MTEPRYEVPSLFFITNVLSRNSVIPLFRIGKYFAGMKIISRNNFQGLRCNEVSGICFANSLSKHGFDSGKHQKCFPTRHVHYNSCRWNANAFLFAIYRKLLWKQSFHKPTLLQSCVAFKPYVWKLRNEFRLKRRLAVSTAMIIINFSSKTEFKIRYNWAN